MENTAEIDPSSVILSEGADYKRVLIHLSRLNGRAKVENALSTWYRILTQYSRKDLTRNSDKLPALSGVASAIHELTNYTYLAGIWKEDPKGLLWYSDDSQPQDTSYRGPSWSWVSRGAVSLRFNSEKPIPPTQDVEIVDAHLEHLGSTFSHISHGYITLKAYTVLLCYQHSRYKHRLDDKPWSLEGFHMQRGQDIDLIMSTSHGFRKGFLDATDEDLLKADVEITALASQQGNSEVTLRPTFEDARLNVKSMYRRYYSSRKMKQCLTIWMSKRLEEADSYLEEYVNDVKGQVDRTREVLYCLLVVEDLKNPGMWRRIGIARAPVEYIKDCQWSEKIEIRLV